MGFEVRQVACRARGFEVRLGAIQARSRRSETSEVSPQTPVDLVERHDNKVHLPGTQPRRRYRPALQMCALVDRSHRPHRALAGVTLFGPLADQNINVDMIIQVVSGNTGNGESMTTDMTFTVQAADYERAMALLTKLKLQIAYQAIEGATDVVKISAIGVGMRSHAGVAARAFRALAEKGVNIRAITTSEIKFSVLIDKDYTELAVRTLHSLYGLDKVA